MKRFLPLLVLFAASFAHAQTGCSPGAAGCGQLNGLYSIGTPIAAAATIAPIVGITHITGTAAIVTITLPQGMSSTAGGCLVLIADAAFTTTTAGNIKAAMTAVANTQYWACYDGALWYIK